MTALFLGGVTNVGLESPKLALFVSAPFLGGVTIVGLGSPKLALFVLVLPAFFTPFLGEARLVFVMLFKL
jgi:hypothetical protein